jgi:hypothetical protein
MNASNPSNGLRDLVYFCVVTGLATGLVINIGALIGVH